MGGLIPFGDASRRTTRFPVVTLLLIVVNALVFLQELMRGDAFVSQWSVIPAQITSGHGFITILTAMFMHASWMHIIGNMIFLWAFGPQIEDAMGRFRITYPRDRIKSVLFIAIFFRVTFIPAALLIGFWFLLQLVDAGSVAQAQTGGVAYLAHVGGFLFGLITARLWEDKQRLAMQQRIDY
jgi:membrane associated rhomboid family serine protease